MDDPLQQKTPPEQLREIARAFRRVLARINNILPNDAATAIDVAKLRSSGGWGTWLAESIVGAGGLGVVAYYFPAYLLYAVLAVLVGVEIKLLRTEVLTRLYIGAYFRWGKTRTVPFYLILFGVGGIVLCGFGFATTRALSFLERTQQDKREVARPVLLLDATYYTYNNMNKFGVVIRTLGGQGKENIEKLVITCPMPGLITRAKPRGNIINAEPCNVSIENFYTVDDKPLRHVAKITCRDVLPGALNGVDITYEPMTERQEWQFNDAMRAEFFWRYEGRLQQEEMAIVPRKVD